MKYIIIVPILILCAAAGTAQAEQESAVPFEVSEKLNELASLTEGLSVSHSPDPVRYTSYPPSLSGIRWQHSTTVSAMAGPVTIVEFGYFVERNGQWEFPYGVEVPYSYTASDFAERYDCPNSELRSGRSYTDLLNRSVIDCVPEQVVRWYFIGLDAAGNRVKGEANVKLLAELDPSEHGPQY